MSDEKKMKVIQALDNGDIDEADARTLLQGLADKKPSIARIDKRPVVNEQHPDIDFTDRWLYKNLGDVDPKKAMEVMKERQPQLKFRRNADGKLLMRRKDEKEWRQIESEGKGYPDEWQDITDVSLDVPIGIAEGVATAAGGTAGAIGGGVATAPTGGWGAIPGAIAGGAAAGTAAGAAGETGRQSLAKGMGMAEELDTEKIGEAALWGAASPLFLGTGAAGKKVTQKAVQKFMSKGIPKEAAEAMAEKAVQAQRSVITRTFGPIVSKTGTGIQAIMSGYKPEALNKLRQMVAQGRMSVDPASVPRAYTEDMTAAVAKKRKVYKDAYDETLEGLQMEVDTSAAEVPFMDLLEKYRVRAEKQVPGFEAKLKEAAQDEATPPVQILGEFGQPMVAEQAESQAAKAALLSKKEVQDYLFLQGKFKEFLDGGRVREGREIVEYMDKLNDLSLIRKSSEGAQTAAVKSEVERDLAHVAKKVVGEIDTAMGENVTGAEFKQVKDLYREMRDDQDLIKRYLKDSKAAEGTLRNYNSPNRTVIQRELQELGEKYGVKTQEYADDMYQLTQFGDPSIHTKSLQGATSTSKTIPAQVAMGSLGYAAGQKMPGLSPFMTALGMSQLGGMLGSPAAMRKMAEMGVGAERLQQRMTPIPQRGANIWQQMYSTESR